MRGHLPKTPSRRLTVSPSRHLATAVRLVWRSSPAGVVAGAVLCLLQGLLPLAAIYVMKSIIDVVASGIGAPSAGAVLERVWMLIGIAALLALATSTAEALASRVSEEQAQATTDTMYQILHAKAAAVDLECFDNPDYYNILERAQREAPFRPAQIVRSLTQLLQSGVGVLGTLALLLSLHWLAAVVLFLGLTPYLLVRLLSSREQHAWERRRTPVERRAQYYGMLLTINLIAKEVRLFGLAPLFARRFRDLRRSLYEERRRLLSRRTRRELAAQAVSVLLVFGAFAFIAHQTLAGALSLGGLVMYFQALQRGQSSFQSLMSGVGTLYEANLYLAHLEEFLALAPTVAESADALPFPRPLRGGIQVDHVSFRYPAAERTEARAALAEPPPDALSDVTLSIRPGEVVALVGENGSGKSTLVKLLCRFYDPSRGAIHVDGVDLRELQIDSLRREIGVVFQDYVQYQLSARENIWFGDPERSPDDARIAAAARASGADRVIAGLEHGYETVLGKYLEDGAELSVGQWQKVALARAFLRDSQIVILDEPSSALDPRAEAELFERFRELVAGRMAILISHRLSTVRMADRIYVLEGGRIVESGAHDALMRRGGVYSRLFEVQARHYVLTEVA